MPNTDRNLIWKSPIYKFLVPAGLDDDEDEILQEIFIDVTASAPNFEVPSKPIIGVLDEVLDTLHKKKPLILDFGAGKLRNTIYLLEKGYHVCAVEFEKISRTADQAKRMYEKAQTFGSKFDKLVFPHEFFKTTLKFDLILLINVCTIMPVPSERLLVLQSIRTKLKEDGFVLWYTMHGDKDQLARCKPEHKLGDGFYISPKDRYQTFYRDFETHEIDEMFFANGFVFHDRFGAGHNYARLYRKVGSNPSENVLNAELIRKYVKGDSPVNERAEGGIKILKKSANPEINDPNPDGIKTEEIYINALSNVEPGNKYAQEYHHLIAAILIRLFMPPLRHPTIEHKILDGQKRIDIVMINQPTSGFFRGLSESHQIYAPYVMVECKNYGTKLGNPALDQLVGRLNDRRGRFGILTFRKCAKRNDLLKKCKDQIDSRNRILTLDDEDLIYMLRCKIDGEGIDTYMDEKMQQLMFY